MALTDAYPASHERSELATPHPEWAKVAENHKALEEKMEILFNLPIKEFREIPYRAAPMPADVPVPGRDLNISESTVPARDGTPIGVRIYNPIVKGKENVLFYNIHGGGWTTGSPETEEAQNRLVAARCNAVVVSVDYRRAPEHPFPYALNDCVDVLKWIRENALSLGVDPKRVIIGGGSAGANISAAITQIARDEGTPGFIGQVLNMPVTCHPDYIVDASKDYHSWKQNADAPIVNAARMRQFWNNYLPNPTPDAKTSPLLATDLANLPPALVQVAGMDPLRDEGIAYAEALKHAGVQVKIKVYPGMPHAFYNYPNFQSTIEYYNSVADWVNDIIAG